MKKAFLQVIIIIAVTFRCAVIIVICPLNGQNVDRNLDVLREIKVGEPMPDIPLGNVANNYTGKTRFSEFKGKLVILDFWATWCSTCVEGFPHMSDLQKEFGDKLQVFLVNPWETQEQINAVIKSKKYYSLNKIPIPDNLPSITGPSPIEKLFPPKNGTGYHVWIGPDGIVKLRGVGGINTSKEKIQDLLSEKKISYVTDEFPSYNGESFSQLAQRSTTPFIQYSSSFAKFNDLLASFDGVQSQPIKDTVNGTIRITYLNKNPWQLYFEATPNDMGEKGLLSEVRNKLLLFVKDTLKYTNDNRWYHGPKTDKVYSENRLSYEQIIPLNVPDVLRSWYMLQDLNLYFGRLYQVEGRIERRMMPCYVLVRTSKEDKLKTKGIRSDKENLFVVVNGKQMINFVNSDFKNVLQQLKYVCNNRKVFSVNDILLDETGYIGKVDMLFPDPPKVNSIEELRTFLRAYDLDIVKKHRLIKMLVIQEKDFKVPDIIE